MSIPKTIHYCWLSDDPMPEKLARCVASWREHCPDYEIINWNFERLGDVCPPWVYQAFEAKKYAFAADWIRAYVMYNFGGIYLDSDVEILKPLDPLLDHRYVFGYEYMPTPSMEAAVLFAEPRLPFFKHLLAYYDGREFIKPDGTLDTYPLPQIIGDICRREGFRFVSVGSPEEIDDRCPDSDLQMVPCEYLSPKNHTDYRIYATPRSFTIHHFAGTWLPPRKKAWRAFKENNQWLMRIARFVKYKVFRRPVSR